MARCGLDRGVNESDAHQQREGEPQEEGPGAKETGHGQVEGGDLISVGQVYFGEAITAFTEYFLIKFVVASFLLGWIVLLL